MTRSLTGAFALIFAVAIGGCAVGPDYHRPETPLPAQFAGVEAARYTPQSSVASFWTVFGDAQLDALVDDALRANHDLRIAVAHLDEARALRGASRLDLTPTVTAGDG